MSSDPHRRPPVQLDQLSVVHVTAECDWPTLFLSLAMLAFGISQWCGLCRLDLRPSTCACRRTSARLHHQMAADDPRGRHRLARRRRLSVARRGRRRPEDQLREGQAQAVAALERFRVRGASKTDCASISSFACIRSSGRTRYFNGFARSRVTKNSNSRYVVLGLDDASRLELTKCCMWRSSHNETNNWHAVRLTRLRE